jgi:hypothetical protein
MHFNTRSVAMKEVLGSRDVSGPSIVVHCSKFARGRQNVLDILPSPVRTPGLAPSRDFLASNRPKKGSTTTCTTVGRAQPSHYPDSSRFDHDWLLFGSPYQVASARSWPPAAARSAPDRPLGRRYQGRVFHRLKLTHSGRIRTAGNG